jgi:hypothetical protein
MVIYLSVNIETGEVDYENMTYMHTSPPDPDGIYGMMEGYEYRPFKITPVEGA